MGRSAANVAVHGECLKQYPIIGKPSGMDPVLVASVKVAKPNPICAGTWKHVLHVGDGLLLRAASKKSRGLALIVTSCP